MKINFYKCITIDTGICNFFEYSAMRRSCWHHFLTGLIKNRMKEQDLKRQRKENVHWLISCAILAGISAFFLFSQLDYSTLVLAKILCYPCSFLSVYFLYKIIRQGQTVGRHTLEKL
jgi:hypothetical protein